MISSANVSDVLYVTHEMVAFKNRLNENSNLNQLSNCAGLGMKNPLNRYIYGEQSDLFECEM